MEIEENRPTTTGHKATKKPFVHQVTYDDKDFFLNYMGCFVPYPWYFPLAQVESFSARDGDICLASFPRSGKSWMSAIVWMIRNNADPSCLHTSRPVSEICPILEECLPAAVDNAQLQTIFKVKEAASPRLYATHLPANLLPVSILQNAKIIYTIRNPKDVVVSMHNCLTGLRAVNYNHDLAYLISQMVLGDQGKTMFGPYFPHVEGFWKLRDDKPNLLICSFEQLKKNMPAEVDRIAQFLGKKFTKEQIDRICRECSFQQMKTNPSANRQEMQNGLDVMDFGVSPYMKKGQSGAWRDVIDKDSNQKMDEWIGINLARPGMEELKLEFD